jgi:hypothetical protein
MIRSTQKEIQISHHHIKKSSYSLPPNPNPPWRAEGESKAMVHQSQMTHPPTQHVPQPTTAIPMNIIPLQPGYCLPTLYSIIKLPLALSWQWNMCKKKMMHVVMWDGIDHRRLVLLCSIILVALYSSSWWQLTRSVTLVESINQTWIARVTNGRDDHNHVLGITSTLSTIMI